MFSRTNRIPNRQGLRMVACRSYLGLVYREHQTSDDDDVRVMLWFLRLGIDLNLLPVVMLHLFPWCSIRILLDRRVRENSTSALTRDASYLWMPVGTEAPSRRWQQSRESMRFSSDEGNLKETCNLADLHEQMKRVSVFPLCECILLFKYWCRKTSANFLGREDRQR